MRCKWKGQNNQSVKAKKVGVEEAGEGAMEEEEQGVINKSTRRTGYRFPWVNQLLSSEEGTSFAVTGKVTGFD